MPRPKNEASFRLIHRKVGQRKLFYARFLDEEGNVITTRATGTDDERKAFKKALTILKTIPKYHFRAISKNTFKPQKLN